MEPAKHAELTQKHGRIKVVSYNGLDLAFRPPTRAEIVQHKLKQENAQSRPFADEELYRVMLVYPDGPSFQAEIADKFPYWANNGTIVVACAQLSGLVEDEELKNNRSSVSPNGTPLTSSHAA